MDGIGGLCIFTGTQRERERETRGKLTGCSRYQGQEDEKLGTDQGPGDGSTGNCSLFPSKASLHTLLLLSTVSLRLCRSIQLTSPFPHPTASLHYPPRGRPMLSRSSFHGAWSSSMPNCSEPSRGCGNGASFT